MQCCIYAHPVMTKPFLEKTTKKIQRRRRKKRKKKEKEEEVEEEEEMKILPVATPFQVLSSKDRGLASHKRLLGEIHTTTRKGNIQA